MNPKHADRLTVLHDGEEIEVFNWVNIEQPSVVRGIGQIEQFDPQIGAGDSPTTPDAVTDWVAELLDAEYHINVERLGIEVVDVESEEVHVL
ncbi:hypothetical protein [Natronocalculus amylovorans]|uniref:Uncharacterized protein n=1 Tax=Natronocalculus amylovorans TaxID=2917812 RepID=A0AAE3G084_9EURY|nr:hypothetical protein [Natronocalculus amylovorans]MCL9818346.1 hypothetical protein [Natronocalculus amylovorans]